MHAQLAATSHQFPASGTADAAERSASLRDLFRGQPSDLYSAGEAVFWEGDEAGHIFDVLEGVLRVYRILPDGRRAIMGFIYPGDVLGVSFQSRYLFTAEAVTDVRVRRFARTRFFALVNDTPELRPQLIAILCDEMSAAQDQMLLLGRKSAEERVVSFLLAVNRKNGVGNTIDLPMSRLDIADYLGLTIETVSRMLTGLTRRGLIAPAGRHAIALRRLHALREIAGGDDGESAVAARPASRRAVWPN
ncbi:MAG: helix-turn-helix domain-containing protein [Roseiarcus sp.]|jgi:CRP/FNR family transcriptional regulator